MLWNTLSLPWQTAVSLAWEAYCAGSLPIGAVIVAEDGRIVAQGRNSIHETESTSPLHGGRLAHAEMNALVQLSKTAVPPQSCALYTTMEPCMMCLGAIRMMRIGTVHFATHDPFAGSACLIETVPYKALGLLPVYPPENEALADVLLVLMTEAMLRTGRHPWVDFVRTAVPQAHAALNLGQAIFASGALWQLGQQATQTDAMLSWLQEQLFC
ncbi:MAG: nucleoside deaminase [Anaerolineaceae bacterium]|nr:nucleoside deaminase [Anaerolineaceae bacterium]